MVVSKSIGRLHGKPAWKMQLLGSTMVRLPTGTVQCCVFTGWPTFSVADQQSV